MRILITGVASGIGAATAQALRSRGHAVAGIDVRQGDGIITADVRDQGQVDEAVARAAADLGGLDVLLNNAGIGEPQDAGSPPDDGARAIYETNFLGAWRVTAAALPHILEAGGRVVNVASGLAIITVPYAAAYAASKRALAAYSDTLRAEYGHRITVTTVYPGYVATPIHRPSEAFGIRLADAVPEDPMEAVVRTLLRACLGPPRRELATSSLTAAGLFAARHFPALTERLVRSRTDALRRRGSLGRASGLP